MAIVQELELEFGPRLNVITGETGAGKSIILRGLDLLGGGKAPADIVRHGTDRAEIEGLFVLDQARIEKLKQIFPWLEECIEDDEIVIRRSIDLSGRSKITINGRMSSKGELEALAGELFEVTGQHSAARLLQEKEHLRLLDEFAADSNPSFLRIRESAALAYSMYISRARALEEFRTTKSSRDDYLRRIRFEAEELERARLKGGERAALGQELERLAGSEALLNILGESLEILEGDQGVARQHFRVRQLLERAEKIDGSLSEVAELVRSAEVQFDEARRTLLDYASNLNADPEHLEALRERVAEIARLERKYGKGEDELVAYFKQIRTELDLIDRGELDEASLRRALDEAEDALKKAERALSAARRDAARRLNDLVGSELAVVNMKDAKFAVEVMPSSSSPLGADRVQFLLAANPGQPPCPLDRVASGGELSRVLLLLKSCINEQNGTAVQVFDEIDTGIGGAVAHVVGEKIKSLTKRYQVILVTHAPQIAALADRHFRVWKEITKGETSVHVSDVRDDRRVEEIARMLAGKKMCASFEDAARDLLGAEENPRKRRAKAA